MNTQLFFFIKVNKQLVKLGKYFADFNFRGLQLTAKYRENWTTQKFPILRYNLEEMENIPDQEIQFTINNQLFLDVLLKELRSKAISYSSYKQKERNKIEKYLMDSITEMENNLK